MSPAPLRQVVVPAWVLELDQLPSAYVIRDW